MFPRVLSLGRAALDILFNLGPLELLRRLSLWLRKVRYRRRNARPANLLSAYRPQPAIHRRSESFRVVFIAGTSELLSRRYRVENIREQLKKQGVESRLVLDIDVRRRWQDALDADVVVFQRVGAPAEMMQFADYAKKCGIRLVFDIDDYLFAEAVFETGQTLQHLPDGERVLLRRLAASYREMLMCCDTFIGSTEFLAEQAAALGRRAFVIRNGLSDEYCELTELALKRRPSLKPTTPKIPLPYLPRTNTP